MPRKGQPQTAKWRAVDWAAVVARKRKPVPVDPRVRFARLHKPVDSGCWEWQGSTKKGYGYFFMHGRSWLAHRVAYEFANGPIPAGLDVCHSCDNRRCVNPSHLWLGTDTDNQQDALGKGRFSKARLTPDAVAAIRADDATDRRTLATRFGVTPATISRVRLGQTWRVYRSVR